MQYGWILVYKSKQFAYCFFLFSHDVRPFLIWLVIVAGFDIYFSMQRLTIGYQINDTHAGLFEYVSQGKC